MEQSMEAKEQRNVKNSPFQARSRARDAAPQSEWTIKTPFPKVQQSQVIPPSRLTHSRHWIPLLPLDEEIGEGSSTFATRRSLSAMRARNGRSTRSARS